VEVSVIDDSGTEVRRFRVRCRIESGTEMEYYRSGGLLPFVLNKLVG
jgi:aconitase A